MTIPDGTVITMTKKLTAMSTVLTNFRTEYFIGSKL